MLEAVGAAYVRSITGMKTTQEIVESIDKRLRELNEEIKTLDAARVALDRHEAQPSRRPPASVTNRRNPAANASTRRKTSAKSRRETSAEVSPASAPRSRKRSRAATSRTRAKGAVTAIPADRLESLLSENGGLTTSALAEETGGNRDHVLRLLRELEAVGRVRRIGQRRATRWQTITDEDRIRERAAELEATRKRPA